MERLFPVTYRQEWIYEGAANGWSSHSVPVVMRLGRSCARVHLDAALEDLVARHEALRTTLVRSDAGLRQRVSGGPELATSAVVSTVDRAIDEPFQLDGGPLVRAARCALGDGGEALVLTGHHVVCDGWSAEVLCRDLRELYLARRDGRAPRLPELELGLVDYAAWERSVVDPPRLAYWTARMREASPRLRLVRRAGADDLPAQIRLFPLGEQPAWVVERLRMVAREERTTLSRVAGAAAVASLAGQLEEHTSLGWISANRDRPEIRDLVGEFEDTVPIRLDLEDAVTFEQLAGRVAAAVSEGYDEPLPSGVLEGALRASEGLRGPLWDVRINFVPDALGSQGEGRGADAGDDLVRVELARERFTYMWERWWRITGLLTYDLELRSDGTLGGYLVVNVNGVTPATAQRLAERFTTVVQRVAEEPRTRLRELK